MFQKKPMIHGKVDLTEMFKWSTVDPRRSRPLWSQEISRRPDTGASPNSK